MEVTCKTQLVGGVKKRTGSFKCEFDDKTVEVDEWEINSRNANARHKIGFRGDDEIEFEAESCFVSNNKLQCKQL